MTVEEQQIQQTGKSELSNLSIKDLFFKYIRFLPLFIICVALSLFSAYLFLRYATLVYQSTGTLVIKDEKGAGSGDKLEQILASDGKKNIQNEIEYLQSRPLMERVVKSLDLNVTYMAEGKFKKMNVYHYTPFKLETLQITDSSNEFTLNLVFEDQSHFHVNGEQATFTFGQVFRNMFGVFRVVRIANAQVNDRYSLTWSPTEKVASELLKDLVIAPKLANTGILNIVKQATNPQLAADVVNQLMREYQLAVIEDKNVATSNAIAFIDSRLRVVQHELDSINGQIYVFMKANNIVNPEEQSTAYLTTITDASKAASEQIAQLSNAELIDTYLRDSHTNFEPVPSSLGIDDPTLNTVIAGYNKAQIDRKSLLENAPPGNVAVKQKEEEIEILRQKVLENLRNIKTAYRSNIGRLQGRGGAAQSQVKTMPGKLQTLADMKINQQGKQVIKNSLLQKREEAAIALASTISNVKVSEYAMANSVPIKPNSRSTQILAILVGLALPALFIFVLELLNDKVSSRNDIEKITSAAILGEVGHSYGKDALVVTQNNRKVVAEQFRILRSNLQYVLNHIPKPVVLVTSSFSGEGKSFISTNMGAVMALSGKKTIVLEFDIRKPKVLSHLNMPKRPGLTNYLLGKVKLEDLPVQVPGTDNLYVLPCGPIPPNPSELLLDEKFNELFDYLRSAFDVVVMDTAPVGMVSDALTLSRFANCTLYIVRQGHTFKKQIGLIDELYQSGKLPKISIVLNDVKVRSGYGYYGSGRYGYGYGYGYGSGYFEEEDVPSGLGRWFGWLDMNKWKKKKKRKNTVV